MIWSSQETKWDIFWFLWLVRLIWITSLQCHFCRRWNGAPSLMYLLDVWFNTISRDDRESFACDINVSPCYDGTAIIIYIFPFDLTGFHANNLWWRWSGGGIGHVVTCVIICAENLWWRWHGCYCTWSDKCDFSRFFTQEPHNITPSGPQNLYHFRVLR